MTNLSFSILQDLNTSRLLFLDTSVYTSDPISPKLFITFPDFNKVYSVNINSQSINILNTQLLGYTNGISEFPDGVYKIKYQIGETGDECIIENSFFRTTKAWNKLDILLQQEETNKDLLEKFNKINLYLRAAESLVCTNPYQAQQLYKQADNILNCYNKSNVRMFEKQCNHC